MIFRFLRSASSINSSASATLAVKRLLYENVLSVFQGLFCQSIVMRNGSDNRNGVYAGVRQNIVRVGCQFHRWIYGTYAIQRFLTDIRNGNYGGVGNIVKITDDIRAPIPVANDTNLQCGVDVPVLFTDSSCCCKNY